LISFHIKDSYIPILILGGPKGPIYTFQGLVPEALLCYNLTPVTSSY